MEGGTVFQFDTHGFESALEKATEASERKDFQVGAGVMTIRQGLRAGLIDDLNVAAAPVLLAISRLAEAEPPRRAVAAGAQGRAVRPGAG